MEELDGSTSDWQFHPGWMPPGSGLEVKTLRSGFTIETLTGGKASKANLCSLGVREPKGPFFRRLQAAVTGRPQRLPHTPSDDAAAGQGRQVPAFTIQRPRRASASDQLRPQVTTRDPLRPGAETTPGAIRHHRLHPAPVTG